MLLLGSNVELVLADGGRPGLDAPVLDVAVGCDLRFPVGLIHRNGDVERPG